MKGFYQVKSIGKRRPVLAQVPFELPVEPATLRELLYAVTASEVAKYQACPDGEAAVLPWLTGEAITDKASVGKVGFGRRYGSAEVDAWAAGDNACQCFEDGMFRVFVDDRELEQLDGNIDWVDGGTLTFIRLTFLSGGWL